MNQHGGRAELCKQGFMSPRGLRLSEPRQGAGSAERPGSSREKPRRKRRQPGEQLCSWASSGETSFVAGWLALEARQGKRGEAELPSELEEGRLPLQEQLHRVPTAVHHCKRERGTAGDVCFHATGCLRGNIITFLTLRGAGRRSRRLHGESCRFLFVIKASPPGLQPLFPLFR